MLLACCMGHCFPVTLIRTGCLPQFDRALITRLAHHSWSGWSSPLSESTLPLMQSTPRSTWGSFSIPRYTSVLGYSILRLLREPASAGRVGACNSFLGLLCSLVNSRRLDSGKFRFNVAFYLAAASACDSSAGRLNGCGASFFGAENRDGTTSRSNNFSTQPCSSESRQKFSSRLRAQRQAHLRHNVIPSPLLRLRIPQIYTMDRSPGGLRKVTSCIMDFAVLSGR